MSNYLLTIKIPFVVNDDIEAREYANKIKEEYDLSFGNEGQFKLQRIYEDKSPVGISLHPKKEDDKVGE